MAKKRPVKSRQGKCGAGRGRAATNGRTRSLGIEARGLAGVPPIPPLTRMLLQEADGVDGQMAEALWALVTSATDELVQNGEALMLPAQALTMRDPRVDSGVVAVVTSDQVSRCIKARGTSLALSDIKVMVKYVMAAIDEDPTVKAWSQCKELLSATEGSFCLFVPVDEIRARS